METWRDLKNMMNRNLKCGHNISFWPLGEPGGLRQVWPEYMPLKWESWSGDVTVRLVELSTQGPLRDLQDAFGIQIQAPSPSGSQDTVPGEADHK